MMFPALHVYQPGNIPLYSENTRQARYATYGQGLTLAFRDVFIHDEPVDEEQKEWLKHEVETRVAPGGVIRYLPSPSPVSGPKVPR